LTFDARSIFARDVENFVCKMSLEQGDLYTVKEESTLKEVLEKITDEKNLEDAVVVTGSEVKGLICDIDVLSWLKNRESDWPYKILMNAKASDVARRDFFYTFEGEKLKEALIKMNENKTTHIILLDKDKHYKGWVTKRCILQALSKELKDTPIL